MMLLFICLHVMSVCVIYICVLEACVLLCVYTSCRCVDVCLFVFIQLVFKDYVNLFVMKCVFICIHVCVCV